MTFIPPQLSQSQVQNQAQRLMALPQMQQAFHLMQLPILELAAFVECHLGQNPIFSDDISTPNEEDYIEQEEDENEESDGEEVEAEALTFNEDDYALLKYLEEDFKEHIDEWGGSSCHSQKNSAIYHMEQLTASSQTLFEHLMLQAREIFSTKEELAIAEAILGNLSADGYLHMTVSEIKSLYHVNEEMIIGVLEQIKQFEPSGIAASCLQESFLIQLKRLGKGESLAVKIIKDHYDDLSHNRIPAIAKSLQCSLELINNAIHEDIAPLDFQPGSSFEKTIIHPIVPDVYLEADSLQVVVNEDDLPPIKINSKYLKMMIDSTVSAEVKIFLQKKLSSAKWLVNNISHRRETLRRIVTFLTNKQQEFFANPQGQLIPMTMKSIAEELALHESTVVRAIANKYVSSPRGMHPLRSFFTTAYEAKKGEKISSQTVRELLIKLIANEDKENPFSDCDLSKLLLEKGIVCARRTVTKHRQALKIGSARQRRKFS